VMLAMAVAMMAGVYPLFSLFTPGDMLVNGLVQAAFACIVGLYIGPVAAVLVELFPTSVRYTGMAIAYNLSAALFGGTAPMVCTWLLQHTGTYLSIAWYVMLCNAVSLLALFCYQDRFREPLR